MVSATPSYGIKEDQLFYDGYQAIATSLASVLEFQIVFSPSDKLCQIVTEFTQSEKNKRPSDTPCLNFEEEYSGKTTSPQPALYETRYITAHKGPCRTAAFSSDGDLIATGSADASIKIISADKVMKRAPQSMSIPENALSENHPVIRTLYDHSAEVTSLQFHPTAPLILSGSRDCTIKLFDYSKPTIKKALKSIQEAEPITCMSMHPSGDYLLVGTENSTLRLYSLINARCFVSPQPADQHTSALTSVSYSLDGRTYVTSSSDGDIRIWDGVSNRCVTLFNKCHAGLPVVSVQLSKNGKYALSTGKDGSIRIWELGVNRCLMAYSGIPFINGPPEVGCPAVFNYTEDYILYPDEKSPNLYSWETRTSKMQQTLQLGHANFIRNIAHSPTTPLFVTCSEDYRARFWARNVEI